MISLGEKKDPKREHVFLVSIRGHKKRSVVSLADFREMESGGGNKTFFVPEPFCRPCRFVARVGWARRKLTNYWSI